MFDDDLSSLLLPGNAETPKNTNVNVYDNSETLNNEETGYGLDEFLLDVEATSQFPQAQPMPNRNQMQQSIQYSRESYYGNSYQSQVRHRVDIPIGRQMNPEMYDSNLPTGSVSFQKPPTLTTQETSLVPDSKAKRRAAVAAASRATRAKRKRELEELKTKNKRLEKQRADYLGTISELQTKVQALRETGSIDIRMENDLLKAELTEHKRFLGHFRNIAQGLPTTDSAKRVMLVQTADSAVSQVFGLLSTSMVDPSWKHGGLKQVLKTTKANVRFQRVFGGKDSSSNPKRVSVRIDIPQLQQSASNLAEMIWSKWTETGSREGFSCFYKTKASMTTVSSGIYLGEDFNISDEFKKSTSKTEKTTVNRTNIKKEEFSIETVATLSTTKTKDRGRLKVFSYAESLINPQEETVTSLSLKTSGFKPEKLLVTTGRFSEVCLSSLLTPLQLQDNVSMLRNKSVEFDHSRSGKAEVIVLAKTFVSPNVDEESIRIENKDKISSVDGTVLEGVVLRDENGGCTMTLTLSVPCETVQSKVVQEKVDQVVDAEGYLTRQWEERLLSEYGEVLNRYSVGDNTLEEFIPHMALQF